MPRYEAFIASLGNLDMMLDDISEMGHEIVSTTYAPESQQVIIFVKRGAEQPKPNFTTLFRKDEE